jgi:hypothetical protein
MMIRNYFVTLRAETDFVREMKNAMMENLFQEMDAHHHAKWNVDSFALWWREWKVARLNVEMV